MFVTQRPTAQVVLAALLTAGASAAQAQQHVVCFYVDKGVPGHCFIQLLPPAGADNPQAGQTDLCYGKYPAGNDYFGGAGVIKQDNKREWDQKICYDVTIPQYNQVATKVNAKRANPTNYSLAKNPPGHCVNWMNDAAAAGGVTLPATLNTDLGIDTPGTFGDSVKAIGNGGVFTPPAGPAGTVTENPDTDIAPDGTEISLNPPKDWDAGGIALASHQNPHALAQDMGLLANVVGLGQFQTFDRPLRVLVFNTDPSDSIISVNWGDNSPLEYQSLAFEHVYPPNPASYVASLTVIDSGAVHAYFMQVQIAPPGNNNTAQVLVPTVPPATGSNPGFELQEPPAYTSVCGSPDFDGDGDQGTDLDIEAFFACLGGDCCPTCGSPDFDGDGDSGTDLDIEAFFRVLGGGNC